MTRRKAFWLTFTALGLCGVGILTLGCGLWFAPVGTGEERVSPNGLYTASVSNMKAGTIRGERELWIEVTVKEVSSGRIVWQFTHYHAPGANVPEYVSRGVKYVVWADDSSSVTVPIAGGQRLTLAVP